MNTRARNAYRQSVLARKISTITDSLSFQLSEWLFLHIVRASRRGPATPFYPSQPGCPGAPTFPWWLPFDRLLFPGSRATMFGRRCAVVVSQPAPSYEKRR